MTLEERVAALEAEVFSTDSTAFLKKEWPQEGDKYWCLNDAGEAFWTTWDKAYPDRGRKAQGNIFRTQEGAEKEAVRRALRVKLKERGFEPDWKDGSQSKWYLYYGLNAWGTAPAWRDQRIDDIYFRTKEDAQAVIDEFDLDVLL